MIASSLTARFSYKYLDRNRIMHYKKQKGDSNGVLYIRYNKNTQAGIVIEKLKKFGKRDLSNKIAQLILKSEGPGILSEQDINQESLEHLYGISYDFHSQKVGEILEQISALPKEKKSTQTTKNKKKSAQSNQKFNPQENDSLANNIQTKNLDIKNLAVPQNKNNKAFLQSLMRRV